MDVVKHPPNFQILHTSLAFAEGGWQLSDALDVQNLTMKQSNKNNTLVKRSIFQKTFKYLYKTYVEDQKTEIINGYLAQIHASTKIMKLSLRLPKS